MDIYEIAHLGEQHYPRPLALPGLRRSRATAPFRIDNPALIC